MPRIVEAGKAEYRHRDEYKEILPASGFHTHNNLGEVALASVVLLTVAICFIWYVYATHPMVALIGAAILLTPVLWKGYVAFDLHMEDKKDRAAQRGVIIAQTSVLRINADHGFNTELEARRGEVLIRVLDPKTGSTSNYYENEDNEEEEDVPQIESPRERSDEYLNISVDYQPHADEFLSGRKLIAGISGSGKSNSVADVCEELGGLGVPMVLADTENEYQALGNKLYLPNAMLAGRSQVTPDSAEQFGHYILNNHKQVILDLTDYDNMEESAWVMVNIIKGMRAWQEKFANELRIPSEFLLEEAPTWLPQNIGESPLKSTEVWQPLQDAFFNNLVRKGRKRGLGVTIICQRVAEIDKRALQSDVKILHRQTEINDLKKYKEMGVTFNETVALQNGEAYYFSSSVSKKLIQMRLRHSPHGANTPGLKALQAHRIGGEAFPSSPILLPDTNESGNKNWPGNGYGNSLETAPELNPRVVDGVFPMGTQITDDTALSVSRETRETIKRLADMTMPNRDIARAVGLSGRKYSLYQRVCREEGILKEEADNGVL